MTIEEIRTIVTVPGQYCLTYRHRGVCVSRQLTIWAVWDAGEYKQVQKGQNVAIVVTSDEWILLPDIRAVIPLPTKKPETEDVLLGNPTEAATDAETDRSQS